MVLISFTLIRYCKAKRGAEFSQELTFRVCLKDFLVLMRYNVAELLLGKKDYCFATDTEQNEHFAL